MRTGIDAGCRYGCSVNFGSLLGMECLYRLISLVLSKCATVPAIDNAAMQVYVFFSRFHTAISFGCNIWNNKHLYSREIEMTKGLILGLALAVVLVSGSFFGALADCGCQPNISTPCTSCAQPPARDYDRPDAQCQGAYQYGPVTPDPMGSPGI